MGHCVKSEHRWIETGLIAFGAVGTILGIGTSFGVRFDILLAFVAGGGWTLVIALLVLLRRELHRIWGLESEIEELKRTAQEWKGVAVQGTDNLNRVLSVSASLPPIKPRAAAIIEGDERED